MAENIFKAWKPLFGLPAVMQLETLHHGYEGLKLILTPLDESDRKLEILFDPALTYRNIDEGDLLFYNRVDGENNLGRWGFFTVEDSDYLKWFNHVSQGIYEDKEIIQYSIYTPNDCLDILSAYPPTVLWLESTVPVPPADQ
ncbi:hypothetical protein [Synechococcus sp. PCC 7336]|uniref:hypothetical protein n=1 Tax=Synechococcus sp. PCC 7336 TaxID=195250 RepID=UPI000376C257|nr:hypothetical protein [Synechococcus sp. PCC 7336]